MAATPAMAATYYCGVAPVAGFAVGDTWRLDQAANAVRVRDGYGLDQTAVLGPPIAAGGMTLRDFTVKSVGADVPMVLETGKRTVSLSRKGGASLMCLKG